VMVAGRSVASRRLVDGDGGNGSMVCWCWAGRKDDRLRGEMEA
jgi:hypothetical protein